MHHTITGYVRHRTNAEHPGSAPCAQAFSAIAGGLEPMTGRTFRSIGHLDDCNALRVELRVAGWKRRCARKGIPWARAAFSQQSATRAHHVMFKIH
jgi:hypothetical protein